MLKIVIEQILSRMELFAYKIGQGPKTLWMHFSEKYATSEYPNCFNFNQSIKSVFRNLQLNLIINVAIIFGREGGHFCPMLRVNS